MFMSMLALLAAMQASPEARTPCRSDTNLVGTWRVVQSRGQQWPDDHPVHKHVTPTHFTVIHWDPSDAGNAHRAHGGTYTLSEGRYNENVQYGFGEGYRKVAEAGKVFRAEFTCWTSGDEWHLEGDVPGVGSLREIWVRVTAAP